MGTWKAAATLLMLNEGTVQLCMKTLSLFTRSRVSPNPWTEMQIIFCSFERGKFINFNSVKPEIGNNRRKNLSLFFFNGAV